MSASREDGSIQSLAATCAILAGLAGLLYSLAFLGLVVAGVAPATGVLISSLMLLLGGLLSSFVLLVVYERVRPAGPMLARWALALGLAGALGALGVALLIRRGGTLPRGLGTLGLVAAALLALTYLGRLTILTPPNPLVAGPAALVGLIVNPAWYVWLGLTLRDGRR